VRESTKESDVGKTQLQIVGTERQVDPEITRAAEEFRKRRNERQDAAKLEKSAKDVLQDVLERKAATGAIQLPPIGKVGVVYRYDDDEGVTQNVKAGRAGLKVKVNVNDETEDADAAESEGGEA